MEPAVHPEAIARSQRYDAACREMAELAGVLNAAHGCLVDLTVQALADHMHVGPGLRGPVHFLTWRLGVSSSVARSLVLIARRVDELPCLVGALRAGEISLDQAAVVARHIDACYDESATEVARCATVSQLKVAMPHFSSQPERPRPPAGVRVGVTRSEHLSEGRPGWR